MAVNRRTLWELDRQRRAQAAILDERSAQLTAAWTAAWDAIQADVLALQEQALGVGGTRRLMLQRKALGIASQQFAGLAKRSGLDISADARQLVEQAWRDSKKLTATQLPADAAHLLAGFDHVDARALARLVKRTTEQITARTWAMSDEGTRAIRRELVTGMARGANPREEARRMVKAAGDQFNGGLVRAQVIARTESMDAYRASAKAAELENSDVLAGWQWCATLSKRTCPSCLAQHGTMHELKEPGPLDHHQGRCSRVPVTKSWEDLGLTGVTETRSTLQPGDGVRWLESQPEKVQRQVLGPSRLEAWQAGRFDPDQWSERRSVDGWRDSYHVGKPTPAPVKLRDTLDMTEDDMADELAKLMESGDFESKRFQQLSKALDAADHAREMEARERQEAEWVRDMSRQRTPSGRAPISKKATEAQLRDDYDLWVETLYRRAEEETNGNMLTAEARAAGIHPRDLLTRRRTSQSKWATPEFQEWLAGNPAQSFADYRAQWSGDAAHMAKARDKRRWGSEFG